MGFPYLRKWIDSKWWVPLVPPCPPHYPLKGKTEKNVSFDSNRPAHAFPYWVSTNLPTTYPFWLFYKNPHQNIQTWHQLSLPPVYPISPGFTRHPVFLGRSLCDKFFPLICCGPSGLGVLHVQSLGRNLVLRGGWFRHISCCDMQCRFLP